jgi:hypothetical protein
VTSTPRPRADDLIVLNYLARRCLSRTELLTEVGYDGVSHLQTSFEDVMRVALFFFLAGPNPKCLGIRRRRLKGYAKQKGCSNRRARHFRHLLLVTSAMRSDHASPEGGMIESPGLQALFYAVADVACVLRFPTANGSLSRRGQRVPPPRAAGAARSAGCRRGGSSRPRRRCRSGRAARSPGSSRRRGGWCRPRPCPG